MVAAVTSTVPTFATMSATDVTDPVILVADDDEDVLAVVEQKLTVAGYRVVTAADGRTALRLVETVRPDMVVLDVSMPGLDGLSVCYELHSSAGTAQIPVLMISGRDRPIDIDLGMTVGADDYLVKPFSPAELVRRVRWLLIANAD